jgi:hypothetical protein
MAPGPGTDARDGAAPAARWTTARRVAVLFVAAWLTVQIGIPAAGLLADPPVRYSWQMYSGLSGHPSYVLVYEDGEEERETHGSLLPWTRADLPYHLHLPQHLCRTEDGLAEVRVVPRDGDEPLFTVPCDAIVEVVFEDEA